MGKEDVLCTMVIMGTMYDNMLPPVRLGIRRPYFSNVQPRAHVQCVSQPCAGEYALLWFIMDVLSYQR